MNYYEQKQLERQEGRIRSLGWTFFSLGLLFAFFIGFWAFLAGWSFWLAFAITYGVFAFFGMSAFASANRERAERLKNLNRERIITPSPQTDVDR